MSDIDDIVALLKPEGRKALQALIEAFDLKHGNPPFDRTIKPSVADINDDVPTLEVTGDRDAAVRDLLDAIAIPAGRDAAAAWDRVCLLYGRYTAPWLGLKPCAAAPEDPSRI